jgi:hypothetical protein
MIYATFFYRDLRNAARGILMGRNIRSAPTLFFQYGFAGICRWASSSMPLCQARRKNLKC